MSIKVKLENNRGIIENKKGLDINKGECIFPFKYKDSLYEECFKGKKGDWCATDINPKSKTIKKWAYCQPKVFTIKKKKKSKKKEINSTKKKKLVIVNPKEKTKPTKKKPKLVIVKPKEEQKPTKKKKKLIITKPFDISDINKKFVIPKTDVVKPPKFTLNNKKSFLNWFDSNYGSYRVKKDSKFVKGVKFSYFNHQKIIRDYINNDSPYRGLLLYHGLGVGKTCGSIAIAEGFKSNKKIVVMLNKSLRENFRDNLKFCGFEFFRTNQHWIYHKFIVNDPMKDYAIQLGISIKSNTKGAWFIEFSKDPNYEKLKKSEQKQLDEQINDMIDKRYTFINMDGLNKKKLEKMKTDKIFNNCVLVVDEVHNLTNAMSKSSPGIRARYLESIIMDAEDLKLVFLSGTPMINNLFETAKLFNLLRGFIKTYEIIVTGQSGMNWDLIKSTLESSNIIDQIYIDKRNKHISITRVPKHFVKTVNGIVKTDDYNRLDDSQFKEHIKSFLPDSKITIEKYTAFPNNEEEFMKLFFDPIKNEFKNKEMFKSRIIGLVSYYRTQDKSLIPTVTKNEIVKVPMSEYQFIKYAKIRKQEIENDKRKSKQKKKKGNKDDIYEIKSSYRAYSRMHCSFVFPESIPRPYPVNEKGEVVDELETDFAEIDEKAEKKERMKKYETEKNKTLKMLDKQKDMYLLKDDPEKLKKYSPKYDIILKSINSKGISFIYTEYKTLEGIAVLSIVLKANGYAPFILKKNDSGDYIQVYEKPEDENKPKYAFWGGGKPEESELIRKIFNNEFDELPKNLKDQMYKLKKTNLRGETIKVLLTTKTGAEGIDLKNVRQVHIVEPYWNPVRTKQVKGRAVRVGSHIQLPESERNVELYLYISNILPAMKKTDPAIEMDKNGATSDEVLYELSQKKLKVMETLLRLIKEASIDCSINYNDTFSTEEPFTCLTYGTSLDSSYSFVPDISKQVEDKDIKRIIKKTSWVPKIISLTIKGKKTSFALKPAPSGKPQLLFDFELLKDTGRPGEPIGEIKLKDGKQKIVIYKKTN